MTPDAIRTHAPKILTEAQRETYFETGFLCAEALVGRAGDIVRGSPATVAHLDPFPCPVPPDWSKLGYGSIFVAQKAEM